MASTQAPTKAAHSSDRNRPWWRFRQAAYERWLRRALDGLRPGRLLKTDLFDEASGPWHHAGELAAGFQFIGIDNDRSVAGAARRRLQSEAGRGQVVVADVTHLPFASGSFAGVISLSTLDHFELTRQIEQSMRELARVLGPDGVLALSLDNPANAEVWLRSSLPRGVVRRLRADAFGLGRSLSRRQGRALLSRAGFAICAEEALIHPHRYFTIRLLGLLSRTLPSAVPAVIRFLLAWESFPKGPLRWWSGHYLAWIGRKRAN